MEGFLNSRVLMSTMKVIVEDGIYHVTQRAPGNELIFIEDNDYLRFVSLLKETVRKFQLELFCFALLSNHLHLLLRIKEKNLSEAMRYLFKRYAQWFNVKYERKGHVFCGAYRAALCCDDGHLLAASVYIHLNPLKAGLAKDIFKYKWTSLNCYIQQLKNPSFVRPEIVTKMLGEKGYLLYKKLMVDTIDLKYGNINEDRKAIKKFSDNFAGFIEKFIKKELIGNNSLASFFKEEGMIKDFLKQKRKIGPEGNEGLLYSVSQLRARGYTFDEVAQRLKIGRSTIYRLLMTQKC
ncbi:MAG: transposase [Candidatus Omnitrophota bacterium]